MERRSLERGPVRHLAYAVVDDRAVLTWIVDATRAGLRLKATVDQALPSRFVLVIPSIHRTLVCDARWASGVACGVSIREERSAVPSTPLVRWMLAREGRRELADSA
jgi:hypothetical protein